MNQNRILSAPASQDDVRDIAVSRVRAALAGWFRAALQVAALCALALGFAACSDSPLEPELQPEATDESLLSGEVVSNLKVASGRPYVVKTGLANGSRVYVDRTYSYRNVPSLVQGQLYIRTGSGDQGISGNGNFLSFTLNRPAEVYVASHGSTPQAWLANRGFKSTGQKLVVAKSKDQNEYTIYSRSYPAGTVSLGSNRDGTGSVQMYTVIVDPSDIAPNPSLSEDEPDHVAEVVSNVNAASGREYVLANSLADGDRVYVDRTYSYLNVPSIVQGQLYIRTGSGDQGFSGNGNFLSFTLNRPAEVYVASHGSTPQAWLANRGFKSTGQKLVVAKSREQNEYTIYSRSYSAGTVSLGSNRDGNGSVQMYTVIIKPGDSEPSTSLEEQKPNGFAEVVAGLRPRGYGQGSYAQRQPASGGTTYFVAPYGNDADAGTSSAPFRTINRAAQVADAGDVVTIREGTYRESVLVRNRGTASKPIVFQAASRGSVVLTGGRYHFVPSNWTGGVKQDGSTHVTLRGLVFRDYSPTEDVNARTKAAVGAIRGWKIEDCLFDRAGFSGLDIRGDSVEVTRSTFQYHHTLAIAANGTSSEPSLRGIRVTDLVLRGNNTRSDPLSGTTSTKVVKFWLTDHTVVDNIESYENNGPGWWFDTENTNWVVRNSYLHDNVGESGRGLYLEKNFAPGRVENNVFARNEVGGLVVRNSQGVTVTGNLFIGDGKSLWLVAAGAGSRYPLKNVTINNNFFKGWNNPASIHAAGDEITSASRMNIVADHNVYEPGARSELSFWKDTGMIRSIAEMRDRLGWERNGSIGTIASPF